MRHHDLDAATADLDPPFAVVDMPAYEANALDLVRRAKGKPIRLASKSIRVRQLIEQTLTRPGFAGVLAYSLAEANWLADQGQTDIVVAYPSTDRGRGMHSWPTTPAPGRSRSWSTRSSSSTSWTTSSAQARAAD